MRTDPSPIGRAALSAACAIFDPDHHILLVRHTYGRLNWELPGGISTPGEAPDQTARRELAEETGLGANLERLSGIYFEPRYEFGPALHFVFRVRWEDGMDPTVSSDEIGDIGFWALDRLPSPMSDFTERRILDAAAEKPPVVATILGRRWRGESGTCRAPR